MVALLERLKHDERTRPLWWFAGWPVGLYFASWYWLPRWTSTVRVEGTMPSGPAVYVHWHRHLPFLLGHNGERRRWLLMSPAPYMQPVLRGCQLMGLRMVLGTSGRGGREALAELARVLARGDSAVFAVDGPAGPALQAKRGCIDLAREARVPIVPQAFVAKRGHENPARWDRMLRPRLFDDVTVRYGAPIDPAQGSVESAQSRIRDALLALDPDAAGPAR